MLNELGPFVEPGIIYGIGAAGLALTYRYLQYPDLTVLGSIVVGGIATVYLTMLYGPWPGLAGGAVAGVLLGTITGVLRVLGINPVLAGVISYTASISFGYLLTEGGKIDLSGDNQLLSSVFSSKDVLFIMIFALAIPIGIALFMSTKYGALLLAMTANKQFRTYRHRYKSSVFVFTSAVGNAIVGLAGGLHAINDRVANVQAHMDFLPLALAGIFLGNAVANWAGSVIRAYELQPSGLDESEPARPGHLKRAVAVIFAVEGERPVQVCLLFVSFIVGTTVMLLLARAIQADILKSLSPLLSFDPDWQYIVVAALMTLFVLWSGKEDEEE